MKSACLYGIEILGAVKAENFLIAELLLTPKLVLFCMEFACLLFMLWIACQ